MIRSAPRWGAIFALFLLPGMGSAQTVEIQQEVEAKLWYQRFLLWIEAVTGLPPSIALSLILVLALVFVGAIWIWYARKEPRTK
jgi:hypothetical protein